MLLGVSGGIAAYKACELVRLLQQTGYEVRVMSTPNGLRFVSALTLQALSGNPVRSELFCTTEESQISHIELADWADVVLIAPATAGLLARLAHGMADDLVATVCLATRAPLVVAPAMNVNMYEHPATQANLDALAKRGVQIVGPEVGDLACGWEGPGRLAALEELVGAVGRATAEPTLAGEVILITAGPTAEPLDPVRVLTNRSSGRMGFALGEQAARRGAEVVLVAGPVSLPTPPGVDRIDVQTASQMRDAVLQAFERATVVIKTAAVSDYRPETTEAQKIKRGTDERTVRLIPNPDILAEVAQRKGSRTVVGFAAETEHVIEFARQKLEKKGCDLIIANDVSRSDVGFDVDRNEVWIVGPTPSEVVHVSPATKLDVAARILDRIREVRRA